MKAVVFVVGYLILAPFVGAVLDGADRVITARMQGRRGPSVLQPFYDLSKLFSKQMIAVNNVQLLLNLSYLVFIVIAGSMLFGGADILMCLFILSTADMFLVMAASSDSSPFANMGAAREMVQMMAYEPLTLLVAVGFYLASGTFHVGNIIQSDISPVLYMPGMLLGFMFTSAIKFRKSPFDLSTSHHAHQEMVKGITTEMSGSTLAIMNIAEYYEKVLILGIFALFFNQFQLVELACGHRPLPGNLFPGNPVGQRQRQVALEDPSLFLLVGDASDGRRKSADSDLMK